MAVEFWLGRGGSLRVIPTPVLGMGRTPDRAAAVHRLLSGRSRVDRAARPTRTWTMSWPQASHDDWAVIYALWDGAYGPGPYWFVDPTIQNRFSPDFAAAGSIVGDLDALWAVDPLSDETLTLSQVLTDEVASSVVWTVPIDTGAGDLTAVTERVGTNPTWVWSAWIHARTAAAATSASLLLYIDWYDTDGALISSSSGTSTSVTSSGWATVPITATAPAGAATFTFRIIAPILGSTGDPVAIHLGRALLQRGTAGSVWYPGQGSPRVSLAALDESLPREMRHALTMTVVEVTS